MFVPVVDKNNKPLMPTRIGRAKRWVKSGKGTFFWKLHMLCVRLNVDPSDDQKQQIAVGIDPGSKREAYTIKSHGHTYLNILSETPDWIKDALETRRNMRRTRRSRNCRRRECRFDNRRKCKLPPSTKARWQLKLRICNHLLKVFSITDFIVEDICAKSKTGKVRWNASFSPLEIGKSWFYGEMSQLGNLTTKQGYETKMLRDALSLDKSKNKLDDSFSAHNVDSWVLANQVVGGHAVPDDESIEKLIPLRFHRRQLHALQPIIGGGRRNYGGTISQGFKRGSLIRNKEFINVYVGGTSNNCISVHNIQTGERISRRVKVSDCKFLAFCSVRKGA